MARPVGVKAELLPAADPTALRSGEMLTLQLLVDGKPAPNAAVSQPSTAAPSHARPMPRGG